VSNGKEPQRALLLRVARRAMVEHGLQPDFPPAALAEANALAPLASHPDGGASDLRSLLWCSIDNDDSRDLDQLTVAEPLAGGQVRIRVAVADVSAAVPAGSALDDHATANTTSIYTPPQNFPMLPDRLSTDLTSLVAAEDRLAVVVDVVVGADGATGASAVGLAVVRNQAKLAYNGVGRWLEGTGPMPAPIAAVQGLAENLQLQDATAQKLKAQRHEHGALALETIEPRALFDGDTVSGLSAEARNRARDLIEDFMIAANGAIARFLEERQMPVMRRVVRTPKRWPRIVEIAAALGEKLPAEPDPKALNEFLIRRRAADSLRFSDLSLSVIKLLGSGEYVASFPGEEITGHFGLAVREYSHSTAPNRRYPDLITQRLVKSGLAKQKVPYARDQLTALATHCTQKEDDVQKIERLVHKSAAACLLSNRIGQEFDGVITGAGEKGTWVRILDPPVEGRIERGEAGLDVGDRVRVKLVHTDPERGYIDFHRSNHQPGGRPA
jgi:exoribonuclease-2